MRARLFVTLALLMPPASGASGQNDPDGASLDRRYAALGVSGIVLATATDGNSVFIGGTFNEAGGVAALSVAQRAWRDLDRNRRLWTGRPQRHSLCCRAAPYRRCRQRIQQHRVVAEGAGRWKKFESGIAHEDISPKALRVASSTDNLSAGGAFDRSVGALSYCLARWEGELNRPSSVSGVVSVGGANMRPRPNPTSSTCALSIEPVSASRVTVVAVCCLGRMLGKPFDDTPPVGSHATFCNFGVLPNGTCFLRVAIGGRLDTYAIVIAHQT